jgi:hypothetical protein
MMFRHPRPLVEITVASTADLAAAKLELRASGLAPVRKELGNPRVTLPCTMTPWAETLAG